MIFPNLRGKPYRFIDLNQAAQRWMTKQGIRFSGGKNPLLNPGICSEMVNDTHKQFGIAFSYGGWLEDRSFIWRGSYMEKDQKFIHLGVDFNAPIGTQVAIDFDATIVRIDNDHTRSHGWGERVIVKSEEDDFYVIYAHIYPQEDVVVGKILYKHDIIARVAHSTYNGGWYPHVHVQILTPELYEAAVADNFRTLDGYGPISEYDDLSRKYRDPMEFVYIQ